MENYCAMPQPRHPRPTPPPPSKTDRPVAPPPPTGRVISDETSRRLLRNMLNENKIASAGPALPLVVFVVLIFLGLLMMAIVSH